MSTLLSSNLSGPLSQNARYQPARSMVQKARAPAPQAIPNMKQIVPSTVQSVWKRDVRPVQTGRFGQQSMPAAVRSVKGPVFSTAVRKVTVKQGRNMAKNVAQMPVQSFMSGKLFL